MGQKSIYYSDKYYDDKYEYRSVKTEANTKGFVTKWFNRFLHVKSDVCNIVVYSRHVVLPKDLVKLVPKTHLMSENEWRSIGVQQSQGWVHYMMHQPGTLRICFEGFNTMFAFFRTTYFTI